MGSAAERGGTVPGEKGEKRGGNRAPGQRPDRETRPGPDRKPGFKESDNHLSRSPRLAVVYPHRPELQKIAGKDRNDRRREELSR